MPSAGRVREIFDAAGLPVDAIHSEASLPPTVVVGRVLTLAKHPNADKLKVTTVDTGEDKPRTIVCGAPNVATGQKVAVALPGSVLPNGMTISEASIRGVASSGMICAEDELGVGSDHAGIMVLPPKTEIGLPVDAVLAAEDPVYTVSVMPNRPDCLSVIGLLREIAAAEKTPLRYPVPKVAARGKSPVSVRIQDGKGCSYYSAQRLTNVAVRPSPSWMQRRLRASGIRPINTVVDVTNYVMLELGQPLHAFDASALAGKGIVVRRARAGETLVTLDGQQRALSPSMTVIADSKYPVALAGVMGGQESAITDSSTEVILESAVFDSKQVYAAAKSLRLLSESSQRFSKGIDPKMTPVALARATELLIQIADARPVGGPVKTGTTSRRAPSVSLTTDWLNAFLGTKLKRPVIMQLLKRLEMNVKGSGKTLTVTPPSYRHDIRIKEDVAEEAARLAGYNTIPKTVPKAPGAPVTLPPERKLARSLSDLLARFGATEHVGYAYVPEQAVALHRATAVKIQNPLSVEQSYMRTSLIPGLYALVRSNIKRVENFRVFELGKEYSNRDGNFHEHEVIACVWVEPGAMRNLKGVLEAIFTKYHGALKVEYVAKGAHAADVMVDGKPVGVFRVPASHERAEWKLPEDVATVELSLPALLAAVSHHAKSTHVARSPFPPVKRDVAFWVDAGSSYAAIERTIRAVSDLLYSIELFDVYEKGGRRSLALHLIFQSPTRTLSAEEVDAIMHRIHHTLETKCHATIRA